MYVQTPLPSGANLSILARVYDRFDGVNKYAVRRVNVTTCSSSVLLSLLGGALGSLQSGRSLNDTQFYRALIIASGEGPLRFVKCSGPSCVVPNVTTCDSTAAAELSTTAGLPPTNVSSALLLLDLLSASRPSLEQDTGATMLDALDGLSSPLALDQAMTVLRITGRLANRTADLTEEMGGVLLQITDRIITGWFQYWTRALYRHLCLC